MEGSVEITIFKRGIVLHAATGHDLFSKEMILTADEADYDPETGDIRPQGHVSMKFQNEESSAK
jgi:hypothetical protein